MSYDGVGPPNLLDLSPPADRFREEALRGLGGARKTLPCKYFYDERGSQLFEQICQLEEYYLTRAELAIMRAHGREMAEAIGRRSVLIEYGCGNGMKVRFLLDHLRDPAAYLPVDISREHLLRAASEIARDYPGLRVFPVCADFTPGFDLPPCGGAASRRVVYFPGSTIGNLTPEEVRDFLRRTAAVCGGEGGLLIGADLKKDAATLEAAYNDRKGVTREFNLNLLERINRELGGDFHPDRFRHRAFYNSAEGRIEMHLVSLEAQRVRIGEVEIPIDAGESIHTENSYKYSLQEFAALAEEGGFRVRRVWTDGEGLFSVQYLTPLRE